MLNVFTFSLVLILFASKNSISALLHLSRSLHTLICDLITLALNLYQMNCTLVVMSSLPDSFFLVCRRFVVSLSPVEAPLSSSSPFCAKLYFGPFSFVIFPDCISQRYQAAAPSPNCQLHHHLLRLFFPCPSSLRRSISFASYPDSFRSAVL